MGRLTAIVCALRSVWVHAVLGVWAIVVVAGLGWLTAYSYSPGMQAVPPALTAVSLPFDPPANVHLLVMAVHPKCPCSRASIGELARILTHFSQHLQCVILVYRPYGESDVWADTDLVRAAKRQPHTRVFIDVDGKNAMQLGMSTSGAVILYSPAGAPEYWGGVTMARGHAGDNCGSDLIRAILSGQRTVRQTAPVFGCAIHPATSSGG